METKRAASILKKISGLKVLVVGDFFLDRYNISSEPTISPEFPVLRSAIKEQLDFPGGGANIAKSFAKLGAKVTVAGFIGENEAGQALAKLFANDGISTKGAMRGGKTGSFMRIVGDNGGELTHFHRLDEPQVQPRDARAKTAAFIKEDAGKFDLVFIADYAENEESIIDGSLISTITRKAKYSAGTSRNRVGMFKEITWVFLNKKEAEGFLGKKDVESHIPTMKKKIGSKHVVLTTGKHGALTSNGTHISAIITDVVDPCGAGDTFASTFCAATLAGGNEDEAGQLAAHGASIAVANRFTYCPTSDEILDSMAKTNDESQDLDRLVQKIKNYKSAGKKIVFTNGFFDFIHSSHIMMLEKAKQLGDVLVVAINSDRSTRENKGPGRPILPEKHRIKIISSLKFVDHVLVFDELTPIKVIMKIKPDILVKGGNFKPEEIIGKDIVESYGGRVEMIIPESGPTTENLLERIISRKPAARHENKRSRR